MWIKLVMFLLAHPNDITFVNAHIFINYTKFEVLEDNEKLDSMKAHFQNSEVDAT